MELLVGILIASLLIGLLLPAVQTAREASRALSCKSHLREIGIALHAFEQINGRLPGGGWGYQWQGFSDIGGVVGQPGGWTYSALPFLGEEELFRLGRYESPANIRDAELRQRMSMPVPVYNCPSRRSAKVFAVDGDCCGTPIGIIGSVETTTRGDYALNVGDGRPDLAHIDSWPLAFWGPADLNEAHRLNQRGSWPRPPQDWTGIAYLRIGVRLPDIVGGLSKCILAGEKYINSREYDSGKDWGDNEGLFTGFNNDNHRSTHPYWPYMRDQPGVMSLGSFGSAHPIGNFVLCDVSVRSLRYDIDDDVFRTLGSRHHADIYPAY